MPSKPTRRSTMLNGEPATRTIRQSMRWGWVLLVASLAIGFPVSAGTLSHGAFAPPVRPHTCLVLGGGGARGAAHIGVLKVLERNHVSIDCVVGTSMGAIVGGLYAAGYSAARIEDTLNKINWADVLDDDPSRAQQSMRRKDDDLRFLGGVQVGVRKGKLSLPQGLIQGQKLQLLLRRLLLSTSQVHDFDRLPIPFRAVATDIGSGDKVVFSHGDLATAIRASMSIPGAFAPITVNGRLLVDGGMVDNLPVDVARQMGARRLIVVDVGSPLLPASDLSSPFSLTNQMLTVLIKHQTDAQIASLGSQDVLITPPLSGITTQGFDQVGKAVAIGEAAADRSSAALQAFSVPAEQYAAFRAAHQEIVTRRPTIGFVDVSRTGSRTAAYLEHRLRNTVGKPLDVDLIERDIASVYGEGRYQTIAWTLVQRDGETGILASPADKTWGPDFLRTALRLSDDFTGNSNYQLLSELNVTGLNSLGGELRGRVGLGQVSALHGEFYQPWGQTGQFSISPYVDYRAYNLPITAKGKKAFAEYRRRRAVAGMQLAWTPTDDWQLSASLERGRDNATLRTGDPAIWPNLGSSIAGVTLRATRDTLDSSGFPSSGSRLDVSSETLLPLLGSDETAHINRLDWDKAYAFNNNRLLFGLRLASSRGGQDLLASYTPLGGLTNLSGYAENAILAPRTALAKVIYYRRLTDANDLFAAPVYVGASLERAGWWDNDQSISGKQLKTAGSVFIGVDTFLGPVFIGYGQAQGGANSFYLTFGPLLRTQTSY